MISSGIETANIQLVTAVPQIMVCTEYRSDVLSEENIGGKTEADRYFLEFTRNGFKLCNGQRNKEFEEIVHAQNIVNISGN